MEMPLLRPLPIPTNGVAWFKRLWRWFSISRKWEVAEDYHFLYKGIRLLIKSGFVFDGASIPRICWGILSPVGLLLIPSIFHDHGYEKDYLWQVTNDGVEKWEEGAGKTFWDRLFLEIGKEVNGVMFADYVAWIAVKAFGFAAWANHRDKFPGIGMEASDGLPPVADRGDTPVD